VERMATYAEAGHEDVYIFFLVCRGCFSLCGRLWDERSHCPCHSFTVLLTRSLESVQYHAVSIYQHLQAQRIRYRDIWCRCINLLPHSADLQSGKMMKQ